MKKIFRSVAALAVVMFAGCITDMTNDVVAPVGGQTTVTVGIEDTKTYLGELVDGARKVYWHSSDQIAINGKVSTATTLNEEKTQAVFSFDTELVHPYSVLYPAEMYKDEATITLPAVQNAATNSFAGDAAPMAAYAEAEGTITLHHLAGVVRLQITLPAESTHGHHQLNKVEFRGVAGEQVSGDFAIDYQTATLTGFSTAEADKVVATKVSKTLVAGETDDVFIVVPAQEYAQGFTVRLIDDAGHYMDIASKAITIEKGEIKAMPVVEFVPTGTLIGVEIKSAEELIAFANAYNAREYAEVEPLVVTLKNDIVFDDATNAAWTPIGTPAVAEGDIDNYFGGCIDGQGFSIKNWNSTRPLFAYTDASAVIENITIDASCTLTANYADGVQYYGAFVGYHRGTLLNCHVNAALTASGDWGTAEPHVGALVGRVVVGTVENCTVNGDVTITNTLVTGGKTSYYGGAVGRVSNGAGVLKSITVTANVSHSAGSTYIAEGSSNNSDAYVNYGGIVGALAGTCTDCHLSEATKTFFYGNFVYKSVDPVENHYRTQSVGGIVGQITEGGSVSDCSNKAAMTLNQYSGNGDVSRYIYAGGIVGITYGAVSNCTMYADFTNRSSCLQQFIGGIVGNVQAEGSVSNCANEGASIAAGTAGNSYYQARNNNIGGVIGVTYSNALSQLSNKAELVCSRMNSKDSATLSMGGIVGKVEATDEIDGNNQIVNYGTIYTNHGQYNNKYTTLGGIAGESKASLKNVINEGKVYFLVNTDAVHYGLYIGGIVGLAQGNITIDSTTNKGTVYFDTNSSEKKHYNICVGGILGSDGNSAAATISNSTHSGMVYSAGTSTNTVYRTMAVGGIAGALTNGDSSITSCTNSGAAQNSVGNNNSATYILREGGDNASGCVFVGGIAGYVMGTAENPISITSCTYTSEIVTPGKLNSSYPMYALRGMVGGLVSYAKYADIQNCTFSSKMYLTNSTMIAGLVTVLENSNLEGCTLSGAEVLTKSATGSGGLVAKVVASTVKNNIVTNSSIKTTGAASKHGILAGIADADSSFTDNKVSGTFQDAAITLDSTMIGTGTPTVTGTTLYTE